MQVRERAISQSGCMYRNTLLDASQPEKSQGRGAPGLQVGKIEVQFLVCSSQLPVWLNLAGHKKSVLNFSAQDAPAALPQNCQTTSWILGPPRLAVNVTLVTRESLPVISGKVALVMRR
jgi:hypothetical protein